MRQKKLPFEMKGSFCIGAPGRTRTGDLRITNALLYQLSHRSEYSVILASEPESVKGKFRLPRRKCH